MTDIARSARQELIARLNEHVHTVPKYVVEEFVDALVEVAAESILDTGEFKIPRVVTIRCYEKTPRRYWNQDKQRYETTDGSGYKLSPSVSGYLKTRINDTGEDS